MYIMYVCASTLRRESAVPCFFEHPVQIKNNNINTRPISHNNMTDDL